jgi:myo-inositol-1(or 4)-monophosphatase
MRGEATYLASGNIIAGTPKVFAPLLNIIQERLPDSVTG